MYKPAEVLLGIDVGTTNVKSVILDAEQVRPLASASREIPLHMPQPGWAEQNPADWWEAVAATARQALAASGVDASAVRGIGLSGQMHGTVCLDAALRPLRPAILWADRRSEPQVADLMTRCDPSQIAAHAPGWPATGYMASTLMWLKANEPDTYRQMGAAILPKDYVRFQLTGTVGTDASDAAATWLFDVARREWSAWLAAACGVDGEKLPPVGESWEQAGVLTASAAEALGMRAGIPVAAGGGDLAAQAVGHGVIDPGSMLITVGTGGQVLAPFGEPRRDPDLRTYTYCHAAPDRWYAQAAILAAGLGLRWLRDILGMTGQDDAYARLSAMAADVPLGSEGLVFVPHLAGERQTHGGSAGGAFVGLRLHHSPGHLAHAVMEGVTFALRECFEIVRSVAGQEPVRVIASGGATASPVWRQIKADVFGIPLALAEGEHHACIGVALLGGVAAGLYGSVADACARLPEPRTLIEPGESTAGLYQDAYERYCQVTSLLRAATPRKSHADA